MFAIEIHSPERWVIKIVWVLVTWVFIVDENARIAIVFEFTCPWDNNIEQSHTYKEGKYSPLVADLANSFSVFHFSVEVSVRGQVTKNNRARLKSFVYRSCRDARPLTKSLTKIISKAALLSSFSLFNARKEPSWISPTPLVVKWSYLITFFFDMFLSIMCYNYFVIMGARVNDLYWALYCKICIHSTQ